MISFAGFSPHPPILLPSVGSPQDRQEVEKTLNALGVLAKRFKASKIEKVIIASPHLDWGFNVPLFFIANGFAGKVKKILIETEPPKFYFEQGKIFYEKYKTEWENKKIGLIGSGDLSHRLKEDGPYGFHQDGPRFDKELIKCLKNKDIENFLNLENKYPEAGNCGLRPFSFILGILESAKINWEAEILSYEGPFGVGYMVVNFKLEP